MEHSELVRTLSKPGEDILASLTPKKVAVWHHASCIPGEVGELLEMAGSHNREGVKEELGDIEFYFEGLRQELDIQRWEVLDCLRSLDVDPAQLATHAAAVFDAVKKWIFYNKEIDRNALLRAMYNLECGLAYVRHTMGFNREEILEGNIEKLSKRYALATGGIGYRDEAAQARRDKEEGPNAS